MKTAGQAVASLALGILYFVLLGIFTAIPAVTYTVSDDGASEWSGSLFE